MNFFETLCVVGIGLGLSLLISLFTGKKVLEEIVKAIVYEQR